MSDDDREPGHHRYRVSTRVMITVFLCLFFMVILVIFLHLYSRRRLRRARGRAMTNQILVHGWSTAAAQAQPEQPKTGLDPAVIDALPVFVYRSLGGTGAGVECSVCLSGLEDGEAARVLPNCNHAFHKECIDLWLHSHSSCPVCRSDAEPKPPVEGAEAPAAPPPSAPPADADNSAPVTAKAAGSSSSQRLSSFRRMLSGERSSRRSVQFSGQEEAGSTMVDLEKL